MKILCETQVVNRQTQTNRSPRAVKATLAVGFHTSAKDAYGNSQKQLEIIHFTPQNKVGQRYKVHNNIEKIFNKFLGDGKATISFRQPPENLLIKCDPIQLKGFLQTIRLGLEGKDLVNLRLNIAATTAIPQRSQPQEKLVVTKRGDYPTKGFPRTLKSLKISDIQLCKVTFDVCSLRHLTILDLSYNNITKIPTELGRLALTEFHMNNNALGETNSWKWLEGKNIKKSLRELNLSANNLSYFPLQLIKLEQLVTLKMNNNSVRRVPFGVRRMRCLRYLHLCSNQLESLPADFDEMRIEVLDVWDNEFKTKLEYALGNQDNASMALATPLWLMAARAVAQYKLPYTSATLPWLLVDIMAESPRCACGKICYAATILQRAAMATFDNVKTMISSRHHMIYADVVLCGVQCAGRKRILA